MSMFALCGLPVYDPKADVVTVETHLKNGVSMKF